MQLSIEPDAMVNLEKKRNAVVDIVAAAADMHDRVTVFTGYHDHARVPQYVNYWHARTYLGVVITIWTENVFAHHENILFRRQYSCSYTY